MFHLKKVNAYEMRLIKKDGRINMPVKITKNQ